MEIPKFNPIVAEFTKVSDNFYKCNLHSCKHISIQKNKNEWCVYLGYYIQCGPFPSFKDAELKARQEAYFVQAENHNKAMSFFESL